jgi:hypothetical protein
MRRRRQVLQVSTFPFLAVLLCAMGSLILLLLVIDRRGKAVALAKAQEAVAAARQERRAAARAAAEAAARAAAERQAARERRRQALHEGLARQQDDLRRQAAALDQRKAAAARQAREERERAAELERLLAKERQQLAGAELELTGGRTEAGQEEQQGAAARDEVTRLSARLRSLEAALADLKAARQRDARTYSLVPYKGRRGDGRRPLYVECTGNGVVFHPDKLPLYGLDLPSDAVRREVERRIARQRDAVAAAGGQPDKTPYLMMLVRPDGILHYYQTLAALKGLAIDFGYEFIDPDWLLDFPDSDNVPAQPWMTAQGPAVEAASSSARKVSGLHRGGRPGEGNLAGEGGPRRDRGTTAAQAGAGDLPPLPPGVTAPTSSPHGPGRPGGFAGGAVRGVASFGGDPGRGGVASLGGGSPSPDGLPPLPGEPGGSATGAPGNGLGAPGQGGAGATGPEWRASGTPGSSPGLPPLPGGMGVGGTRVHGLQPAVDGAASASGAANLRPGSGGTAGGPAGGAGACPGPGAPGAEASATAAGGSANEPGGTGPRGPPPSGDGPGGPSGPGGSAAGASAGQAVGAPTGTDGAGGGSVPPSVDGAMPPPGLASRPPGGGPVPTGSAGGGAAGASPGEASGVQTAGGAASRLGGSMPAMPGASPPRDAATQAGPDSPSDAPPPLPWESRTARSGAAGSPSAGAGTGGAAPPNGAPAGAGGSGGAPDPGGEPADPETAGSPSPGRLGLPPLPGEKSPPPRPAPVRPARLIGNRDWVIPIECLADGVVLRSAGKKFPLASFAGVGADQNALLLTVRLMIVRRQASVRPGDPPYRPQVRFLLHPDGLRTYHLAYPALEPLGIPLTRQNVETPPEGRSR